jgi:MarR family transcriptional regulator, 2-MHQ and catechol-resistance regulon repressor
LNARAAAKAGKAGEPDQVQLWRSVADSWKRVQRAAEKNLLRSGLAPAELRILRVLREHGSSPMNRFCAETMLSQPSITGVVDKLEERGLVERVRSLEDRREVLIAITRKGSEAYAKGEETHRRFVERSLSVLREEEVVSLVELLKRLADASDSLASDAP